MGKQKTNETNKNDGTFDEIDDAVNHNAHTWKASRASPTGSSMGPPNREMPALGVLYPDGQS
jgi:hypothetical protein